VSAATQRKISKNSLTLFKEKIKTRQHTGDIVRKENETNDKFKGISKNLSLKNYSYDDLRNFIANRCYVR
jgi:hypothetical protein